MYLCCLSKKLDLIIIRKQEKGLLVFIVFLFCFVLFVIIYSNNEPVLIGSFCSNQSTIIAL